MRKRLVIGAIAVVVIGVGALWYSRSREQTENSIEYHKIEYLAARDGRPLMNEVREIWGKVTGRNVRPRISAQKLQRHEQALLRLGYWDEQTIIVSNIPALAAWNIAAKKGANRRLAKEIAVVAVVGTNTIVVRAVPQHIPIWAGLIRDTDVPEAK